jgi:hypothetical protein
MNAMTTTATSDTLTRYLRHMLGTWEHEERTDAKPLTLFAQDRNEQAFATLVRRYSVLVWGVCFRILGHREEAEDVLLIWPRAGKLRPQAQLFADFVRAQLSGR